MIIEVGDVNCLQHEFKVAIALELFDIVHGTRPKRVHHHDPIPLLEEKLDQMMAKEAGSLFNVSKWESMKEKVMLTPVTIVVILCCEFDREERH